MKTFKRIQAMFLATVIGIMTFGTTTAFAAESTEHDNNQLMSKAIDNEISPRWDSLQYTDKVSITTTKSAAGTTFSTPVSQIKFDASFKSGVIVAIRLHDVTFGGNRVVHEWQSSNGSIKDTVNVGAGGTYIFEYLLASGAGTVNVTNKIYFVEPF